jgi:hypothetical protein
MQSSFKSGKVAMSSARLLLLADEISSSTGIPLCPQRAVVSCVNRRHFSTNKTRSVWKPQSICLPVASARDLVRTLRSNLS